jgi:hypothetical protein
MAQECRCGDLDDCFAQQEPVALKTPQIASWLIWNKGGFGGLMGSEHATRVRQIMEEAFGSVGVKPTIKIPAFNQEAQDARRSDPDSWVD